MYCSSCGNLVAENVNFCSGCGKPTTAGDHLSIEKRPIAGIAVGAVAGIIGVAWSIFAIFKVLYSNPAGVEATMYGAFPALQSINYLGAAFGLLGNSALLVGVLLSFLRHHKGYKTVRITSYFMFVLMILLLVASYFAVTSAPTWQALDAPTKGGIIGGLIGGVIGGFLQWGLILFLFSPRSPRRAQ